jgi:hypothetical protein
MLSASIPLSSNIPTENPTSSRFFRKIDGAMAWPTIFGEEDELCRCDFTRTRWIEVGVTENSAGKMELRGSLSYADRLIRLILKLWVCA